MILKRGELIKNKHEQNSMVDNYHIELLPASRIEEVVELQLRVYEGLPDKDILFLDTKDEMLDGYGTKGHILGIINSEDQLIGYRYIAIPGIDDSNLGNDIGLSGEELNKVCHLETTVVDSAYRGNGLQDITLQLVKAMAKDMNFSHLMCTVSPNNFYSLYNNMKNGLKISKLKKKYADSWRFILHIDMEETIENPIDNVITKWTDKLKQKNLLDNGYIGVSIDKTTRNIKYALFDDGIENIA